MRKHIGRLVDRVFGVFRDNSGFFFNSRFLALELGWARPLFSIYVGPIRGHQFWFRLVGRTGYVGFGHSSIGGAQ